MFKQTIYDHVIEEVVNNSDSNRKFQPYVSFLEESQLELANNLNYRDQTNAKYLLIAIKKYYESSKDVDNCRVLLNEACRTTNLIPDSKIFFDFGNEQNIF